MRKPAAIVVCMLVLALAFVRSASGQMTTLEVIPLKYRTAEQVIPVLQPLVGAGGSVSGFQGQLIVRATPAALDEIRRVLASIDRAPRRLLVTVRQDVDGSRSHRSAEVSGTFGAGGARIYVPGSGDRGGVLNPGDERLRAQVRDAAGSASERNVQTIQVLEGNAAFIRTGESRPVPAREVRRTVVGGQVVEQVIDTTAYANAATGVYVVPRVSGDRVTLEISPQRESFTAQGAIETQRVSSAVSGRLGEWIELAGANREETFQGSVLLGAERRNASERRAVLVKVEEIR